MSIRLCVITPHKAFFDGDADTVIINTEEGCVELAEGLPPVTANLAIGELTVIKDGEKNRASVMGGFAEFMNDKMTIVTDAAEWRHEIDVKRAEEAKARAEKMLKEKMPSEGLDIRRANKAIKKAEVRIGLVTDSRE